MSNDESSSAVDVADVDAPPSIDALAALKEKISDMLVKELESVSSYMYESEDTVQLKDQDTDKAAKLLFGNVFDVENEWDDKSSDYHYGQDVRAAKEKLSELLDNDFQDEIETVAEQLGLDADELTEELREDDCFTPQEIGWSGHFTKIKYEGSVAAYADLNVYISIEPNADMFATLNLLRIKPEDFLSAVHSKMVEDEADEDSARDYELTEAELEDADGSIIEAYRQRFQHHLAMSEVRYGYCHQFSEPPVVKVRDLVDKIIDEWSSTANLYVNLALDSSTIDDVSKPLGRMDVSDKKPLNFVVTGGYISNEASTYVGDSMLEISAPFEVPRSAFRVNNESPDRDLDGALQLAPRERAYSALYNISVLDDTVKKANREDPKVQQRLTEAITKIVDTLPAYALPDARQGAAVRAWGDDDDKAKSQWVNKIANEVIDARQRCLASASAQDKGQQLLTILHQVDTVDAARDEAKWLIHNGADVNIRSANGFTPALLCAIRRDVDLLSALRDAGADLNVVREVSLNDWADNALSLALRSGSKAARKGAEDSPYEAAEFLLNCGVGPVNAAVLASNSDSTEPHAAHLGLNSKSADFFAQLLDANALHSRPDEHKQLVDGLFVRAVTDVLVGPGAALIEAGADLDQQIQHGRGREGHGLAEQVLEHIGTSSSVRLEETKQFRQMIQSARAKRSIDNLLQKVRPAARPA